MESLAFTDAERALLAAFEELGVRYLIVGLSAAVLQGADTVTAAVDLWFEDRSDARIGEAARRAGGVWIPGSFGMMPPTIGGAALGDRFDVVLTLDGLSDFATEMAGARVLKVDGLDLPVLPLERVSCTRSARPRDVRIWPSSPRSKLPSPLSGTKKHERLRPFGRFLTYDARRASAGLIVTEGTSPSPNGLGYARVPGLYSEAQFEGWKLTTKAVHDKGSRILVQLMHMGLVGRPANLPKGARVLGPTPIAAPGKMALPSSLTTQRSRE